MRVHDVASWALVCNSFVLMWREPDVERLLGEVSLGIGQQREWKVIGDCGGKRLALLSLLQVGRLEGG